MNKEEIKKRIQQFPGLLRKETDKIEKDLTKKILKQYELAQEKINQQLHEIELKYFAGKELSYSEMIKFDRLSKLNKRIQDDINELYKQIGKELDTALIGTYNNAYLYSSWILETGTGVSMSYTIFDKNIVRLAIQNSISGLTLNDRLKANRANIILKTRESITRDLIQGKSVRNMAKNIKDLYEGDMVKSTRIIRTEVNRIMNTANLESYKRAEQAGLKFRKKWLSAKDNRVRDTHKTLNGQYADKNGLFWSNGNSAEGPGLFGIAKEDIHCRCTTIVEFPEAMLQNGTGESFKEWSERKR